MSDEIQEVTPEDKGHVWWYRETRTSNPTQHEFPMPMARQDVENAIAKMTGHKELPSGAVVSMKRLERLAPVVQEPDKPEKPEAKKA